MLCSWQNEESLTHIHKIASLNKGTISLYYYHYFKEIFTKHGKEFKNEQKIGKELAIRSSLKYWSKMSIIPSPQRQRGIIKDVEYACNLLYD